MNKYIEHKKVCFLCDDAHSVMIKNYKAPCPRCNLANFLNWSNEEVCKTIQNICVDCGDLANITVI